MLEKLAKKEPEQYATSCEKFRSVFEGRPAEIRQSQRKSQLLRFAVHQQNDDSEVVGAGCLYRNEHAEVGQESITESGATTQVQETAAPGKSSARKALKYALLTPIDEWLMQPPQRIPGQDLRSTSPVGDLDLGSLEGR